MNPLLAVKGMASWAAMYGTLVSANLRSQFAYRWDFFVSLGTQALMYLGELAMVLVVVSRAGTIAGWDAWEIAFLFGLVTASSGFYEIFGFEFREFDHYIVNGDFDAVLTRPVPTLLTVAARSARFDQAGLTLQGLAVVVAAADHLGPAHGWTWGTAALIGLVILCGAVIWLAMIIAGAALAFWVTRVDDLQPIFLFGPQTANEYPLGIYPKAIRWLFYSVMPVAFGSYLPAGVLLGKGPGEAYLLLTPAVAVLALAAAAAFWNLGVRHYESTGSAR